MSWSYKITILYSGFVLLILSLVFISSKNKEELVAKDYYSQELQYQERIDAINNSNALMETISHEVASGAIKLSMPAALLTADFSGEIYFYCPANSAKDVKLKMQFDENGEQVIALSKLQRGIYKMKLEWLSGGKKYYKEEVITVK